MRVEGLAQELRNLREAAGLSQEILGSLIGLPQKTIEAMENDRQRIPASVETLWRTACRQYMAYKAIRFGTVPRTAAKFDSEQEAQRLEDALQQSLDRARTKKQKRSKQSE